MSKESEIRTQPTPAGGNGPVDEAASVLRRRIGEVPKFAAVLGSGFAPVLDAWEIIGEVAFGEVPGMSAPGVPGHQGRFVLARIEGIPVLLQVGRLHYYEGHSMAQTTFSIRVMEALGINTLLLTNAAGGINKDFAVGDFMLMRDHVNFMGANPLAAATCPANQRFVNMNDAYDPDLRARFKADTAQAEIVLQEGVYFAVSGPSYETPAEITVFRTLGADAVGMSTVPETIVARSLGIRVIGLSCITNLAAGLAQDGPDHEEVLSVGRDVTPNAVQLLQMAVRITALDSPCADKV